MAPLVRALSLVSQTVFGGVSANRQISALFAGVDVLVACPGRLADHVAAGHAHLDAVEVTVLDEADYMADLGFLPVVRKLLDATPLTGQRLLFSATLHAGVDVMVKWFLHRPVPHAVDPPWSPVATMSQHILQVSHDDRVPVLVDLTAAPGRTLVFTRTKTRARTLTRPLVAAGVPAVELHGNLAQSARSRNLLAFSAGAVQTMVATDIAARGIHVDDVILVIHADPSAEYKAYLHRSGRTAGAGAAGTVITLMTDDQVNDVRQATRSAGIMPVTTRLGHGNPLPRQLAPADAPSWLPRQAVPPTSDPTETAATYTRRGRATAPRRARSGRTYAINTTTPTAEPRAANAATLPAPRAGAAAVSARSRSGRPTVPADHQSTWRRGPWPAQRDWCTLSS